MLLLPATGRVLFPLYVKGINKIKSNDMTIVKTTFYNVTTLVHGLSTMTAHLVSDRGSSSNALMIGGGLWGIGLLGLLTLKHPTHDYQSVVALAAADSIIRVPVLSLMMSSGEKESLEAEEKRCTLSGSCLITIFLLGQCCSDAYWALLEPLSSVASKITFASSGLLFAVVLIPTLAKTDLLIAESAPEFDIQGNTTAKEDLFASVDRSTVVMIFWSVSLSWIDMMVFPSMDDLCSLTWLRVFAFLSPVLAFLAVIGETAYAQRIKPFKFHITALVMQAMALVSYTPLMIKVYYSHAIEVPQWLIITTLAVTAAVRWRRDYLMIRWGFDSDRGGLGLHNGSVGISHLLWLVFDPEQLLVSYAVLLANFLSIGILICYFLLLKR